MGCGGSEVSAQERGVLAAAAGPRHLQLFFDLDETLVSHVPPGSPENLIFEKARKGEAVQLPTGCACD